MRMGIWKKIVTAVKEKIDAKREEKRWEKEVLQEAKQESREELKEYYKRQYLANQKEKIEKKKDSPLKKLFDSKMFDGAEGKVQRMLGNTDKGQSNSPGNISEEKIRRMLGR